jgi:hypothetical protein
MKAFYRLGPFFVLPLACSALFAADDPVAPGPGFAGDRYAGLWTKSPFAIATPDIPASSTDYQLVGIAQFDGITYVNLIERQPPQEHFVLTSAKSVKNLTLVSVNHGKTAGDSSAVISRNGEMLTLKLEAAPVAGAGPGAPPMTMPMPAPVVMPGQVYQPTPFGIPPHVRVHRPLINVPPPPPSQ